MGYACACGASGDVPMAGGGKLTWRVDWPARWAMLGVSVEPFGKDHATRGGSYDTGARIAREVFDYEPPLPVPYEWISLKGQGRHVLEQGKRAFDRARCWSSSRPRRSGISSCASGPNARSPSTRGCPCCSSWTRSTTRRPAAADSRALALSRAAGFTPVGVPVQAPGRRRPGRAVRRRRGPWRSSARTGYIGPRPRGRRASVCLTRRRWLDRHAPEEMKFEVNARRFPPRPPR